MKGPIKRKYIIAGIFGVIMIVGSITAFFLAQNNQTASSHAQVTNNQLAQSANCQPPGQVTGVTIEYPYCQTSTSCSFTQADCKWTAVSGTANYTYKITEVDSGTVVQDTTTVPSSTTEVVFPVTNGKTYKCDVTAVSTCGSTGATGTDSLLCQTSGQLTTPTQIPPPPGASPTPIPPVTQPPATPVPTAPTVLTCGQTPCNTTNQCEAGLVCVQASNGQSYCAQAAYANACQQSPSTQSCCFAPAAPRPTIPPTGDTSITTIIAGGSAALFIGGAAMLLL